MKNNRKLSKEEKEMQALMKKLKKSPKIPKGVRYQDPTTLRNDEGVEDALDLFQEMKRRDF